MLVRAIVVCPPALLALRLRSGVYRRDENGELEKRCSRCREYWPADNEFFHAGAAYDDGLHCQCKACFIERRRRERRGTPHHDHANH